ncbi:MAG: DUF3109 family protein [Dysgonamonadaceae bacterium]|jgi:hypothetical protein|nr:DUF3109 family protein [Dysgonamonadaceae bacterium]
MIVIQDTIISPDVLEEYFQCDLSVCKGNCCVEGDSGAPLEEDEVIRLEEIRPLIWDDLSIPSRKIIEEQDVAYLDADDEYVTSLSETGDCAFAYYDKNGCCKCVIEKVFREGKIDFYKPVSCHLYPVRVDQYKGFRAVNYHRWSVCEAARILGKINNVKVYQFLKEPLIRKFGEEWYEELEKEVINRNHKLSTMPHGFYNKKPFSQ